MLEVSTAAQQYVVDALRTSHDTSQTILFFVIRPVNFLWKEVLVLERMIFSMSFWVKIPFH